MYFLCVIHKKERKSSFLLHLLTNDGKKITLFQNYICETMRAKKRI